MTSSECRPQSVWQVPLAGALEIVANAILIELCGQMIAFTLAGLIAAVIVVLICRQRNLIDARMLSIASPALIAGAILMAGLGSTGVGPLATPFVIAISMIGAIGDLGMLLVLGRYFSALEPQRCLMRYAPSLCLGLSASIIMTQLVTLPAFVLAITGVIASCVTLAILAMWSHCPPADMPTSNTEAIPRNGADTSNTISPEEERQPKLNDMADFIGKSLMGFAICSLISGLSIGASPVSTSSASMTITQAVGYILAAIIVVLPIIMASKRGKAFDTASVLQGWMPVVTVVILVVPYVLDLVPDALILPFHLLNTCAFGLMNVIAFFCIATSVWVLGLSSDAPFAIGRMLGAGAQLIGILVGPLLTISANKVLCAMLLAAYLIILVMTGHDHEQTSKPADPLMVDMIDLACKDLACERQLSPRETEILSYLGRGHGSTWIAEHLCISIQTVKTHAKHIHEKLGVSSRDELLEMIERRAKELLGPR